MRPRIVTASIWIALLGLAYLTLRAPGLRSRELVAPAGGVDTHTAASAVAPSDDDDEDADAGPNVFGIIRVSVCVSGSGLALNGCSFNCANLWAF